LDSGPVSTVKGLLSIAWRLIRQKIVEVGASAKGKLDFELPYGYVKRQTMSAQLIVFRLPAVTQKQLPFGQISGNGGLRKQSMTMRIS